VLAARLDSVALPTFANAAFDGARMVMLCALPRAWTSSGTNPRTVLNVVKSFEEFKACARVGVFWAKAWLARARRESCLTNILILGEGGRRLRED
jgi:hypothetical protein